MRTDRNNWKAQNERLMSIMNREQTEFRSTYLQPALRLRDEIIKRLQRRGIFIEVQKQMPKPTPTSPEIYLPITAFGGMLGGPTPIADMADFLESAASKLQ